MLFSERSLWTMAHGIGLGGAALLALAAALFGMYLLGRGDLRATASRDPSGPMTALSGFTAAMLWLTSVVGTYIVFPPYRATPPEGTQDLAEFPRAFILSSPETAWLHSFAMETKEHLPWVATMLATAVAFIAWRYRGRLFTDRHLRTVSGAFLALCFVIVSYVSLLGVLVNKVAPLD